MSTAHRQSGFSLTEALVALGILTVIIVGFLSLYDTSAKVAKSQGNISDATENLRFSVAALVRLVRMAGTGGLPLVYSDAGGNLQPLALVVADNQDGSIAYGGRNPIAGTDVLRIRGVISGEHYDVRGGADVTLSAGSNSVLIHETSPFSSTVQPLHFPATPESQPFMLSLQTPLDIAPSIGGVRNYNNYRLVTTGSSGAVSVSGTAPNRTMTVNFDTSGTFTAYNPGGIYQAFDPGFAYAAGFLDDMVFFIAQNPVGEPTLYRALGTGNAEEMVPNIVNMQVALGCDINRDGVLAATEFFLSEDNTAAPTGDQFAGLREVRLSLVARSQDPEIGTWNANPDMPENAANLTGDALRYRYRTLTVRISLRSHPPLV